MILYLCINYWQVSLLLGGDGLLAAGSSDGDLTRFGQVESALSVGDEEMGAEAEEADFDSVQSTIHAYCSVVIDFCAVLMA